MNTVMRFTKTFTEVQSNTLVDGGWQVSRVSETPIDDLINGWVQATQNVIIDVFTAVEHSSVQTDQYLTKVRYVVTYMEQEAFKQYDQTGGLVTRDIGPGAQAVGRRNGGPPSQEDIAAAVAQIARNKVERGDDTPLPVDLQSIPNIAALIAAGGAATGAVPQKPNIRRQKKAQQAARPEGHQPPAGTHVLEEADNPEDAEPWQEAEGAAPEEARREAEVLATELQTALVNGNIPSKKTARTRGKRVVEHPTPPIQVLHPTEGEGPATTQVAIPPAKLEGIPNRRGRSR